MFLLYFASPAPFQPSPVHSIVSHSLKNGGMATTFGRFALRKKIGMAALLAMTFLSAGCTIKYSFDGANIPVNAETFSVGYFRNDAQMVAPMLSDAMTNAMIERLERQTRLTQVKTTGKSEDQTGYDSRPSSVSGNEYTTENRLTITVRVQFTNTLEPQYNYSKSFSAYLPYPTSTPLQSAENSLIPEIVEDLVTQIFNAALSNW